LKKYSLTENTGSKKNVEEIAKHITKIHAQNISQDYFEIYGAKWIAEQVHKIKDVKIKDDISVALKTMSQAEVHNAPIKRVKFLSWDIIRSDWQKDYQSGKAGSGAWDIACVINRMNDAKFSEIFLEVYLRHGGDKPTLIAIYANL
jgi:hypothetical protein